MPAKQADEIRALRALKTKKHYNKWLKAKVNDSKKIAGIKKGAWGHSKGEFPFVAPRNTKCLSPTYKKNTKGNSK